MTKNDLLAFLKEHGIEMRWSADDLLAWIPFDALSEFTEMVGEGQFCEGDFEVTLLTDCVCIELDRVCGRHDIDHEDIWPKK